MNFNNENLLKLNLGCGNNFVEGYQNIDFSPNVLLSKIKWLKWVFFKLRIINEVEFSFWNKRTIFKDIRKLKYSNNSISHIYTSHTLEHIFFWEAEEVLKDCYRMLIPKGIIRIALPDLDAFIDQYLENRNSTQSFFDFETNLLSYPVRKPNKRDYLINVFFKHVHKWHPNPVIIIEILNKIGFKEINLRDFQMGKFPNLTELENRNRFTFYIEASK